MNEIEKKANSRKTEIHLNISPEWRAHWTLWHAIRELVQNAMDEKSQYGAKVFITTDFPYVIVYDTGRGIPAEAFHLGSSAGKEESEILEPLDKVPLCKSKATVRGAFRTGLKEALAVFARNNIDIKFVTSKYTVTIETKDVTFIDKTSKSLYAIFDFDKKLPENKKGTETVLEFIRDENGKKNFDEISSYLNERFIITNSNYNEKFKSECGSIITKTEEGYEVNEEIYIPNKVFIKDIFVTEKGFNNYEVPSLFSYNINDSRVFGGDDRDNIKIELLKDVVDNILSHIDDKEVIKKLMKIITSRENELYLEYQCGNGVLSPDISTDIRIRNRKLWKESIEELFNPNKKYKEIVVTSNSDIFAKVNEYLYEYKCLLLTYDWNIVFQYRLYFKNAEDLFKGKSYIVKTELDEKQLLLLKNALKVVIPWFNVYYRDIIKEPKNIIKIEEAYEILKNSIFKYSLSLSGDKFILEEMTNAKCLGNSFENIQQEFAKEFEEKGKKYKVYEISKGIYINEKAFEAPEDDETFEKLISTLEHEFGHTVSFAHNDLKAIFQGYLTETFGRLFIYISIALGITSKSLIKDITSKNAIDNLADYYGLPKEFDDILKIKEEEIKSKPETPKFKLKFPEKKAAPVTEQAKK